MANSDTVKSVQRALDMVEQIGRAEDGLRLNDLAAALSLKKTTAHNLLRTLFLRGFVHKDEAHRYRLGPMFEELTRHRYRRGIFQRAATAMRRLHIRFPDATLTFSELAGHEIVCRLRMAPELPGKLQHPQSQTFNPFGSASGLCLYALNPGYRDLMSGTEAFDESGRRYWADRTEFEQAVAETIQRGMARLAGKHSLRLATPVGENYVLGLSLDQARDIGHPEEIPRDPARDNKTNGTEDLYRQLMATAADIAAKEIDRRI